MKKIIITIIVLLLIAITPVGRYAVGTFRPVKAVSLDTAMASIGEASGRPTLIVLYGPRCPLSRRLFPQVVQLAQHGVDVQAYSVDDGPDAMLVGGFMNEFHAGFPAQRILPWQPGQLSSRMGELGVSVPSPWVKPLVLVRNNSGQIIYQDMGVTDIEPAAQALALAEQGG
jgi:hypothetical protein